MRRRGAAEEILCICMPVVPHVSQMQVRQGPSPIHRHPSPTHEPSRGVVGVDERDTKSWTCLLLATSTNGYTRHAKEPGADGEPQ